jgi:hypothetical protein
MIITTGGYLLSQLKAPPAGAALDGGGGEDKDLGKVG